MKCKNCVFYCKCREIPSEEDGCRDFKDQSMFVELPFHINQLVYYIEPATKYVPVVIDGAAYFRLEDDSRVKQHLFTCEDLQPYLEPILPFRTRTVKKYFTRKEDAEKALAEVVKKNGK